MTFRIRFILITLCWFALVLDILYPGQFRFYLVHDGGLFQLDFSGSANGSSPTETNGY